MDALVTRESRNTDLWWHLSTGALIVRHYQLSIADAYPLNGPTKFGLPTTGSSDSRFMGPTSGSGSWGTTLYLVAIAIAIGLAFYQVVGAVFAKQVK